MADFRGMLLNGHAGGFAFFLRRTARKSKVAQFFLRGCDLHRNYGMAVILLSFLCNYDNLDTNITSGKTQLP